VPYFPPIPENLLAALARQFPDQAPDLTVSDKEVWFRAGQVSVVRWLVARLEDQKGDDALLINSLGES
jgi:hypothetical protein